MSSKTKIVVLHLKELIYTGIFAVLGILFIILLIIMFLPRNKDKDAFEDLVIQICENQSLDGITYADDNKYTSMVLLDAIRTSLQKAEAAAKTADNTGQ